MRGLIFGNMCGMKFKFSTLSLGLLVVFSGCHDSVTTRAKIFERKILSNDSLMIYYSFLNNELIIKDSAIVQKDTIVMDSIDISYAAENPENNHILVP